MITNPDNDTIIIAALYAFRPLNDFADRRPPLLELASEGGVVGTLLLAEEGVNGTIAGSRSAIDAVIAHIRAWPGFQDLNWKESVADKKPFLRLKVRLKSEIVTMGIPGLNPETMAGTYVAPEDWNQLISRDDVVVIDTRNDFEVEIGTFEGAINPGTKSFSEFPDWSKTALSNKANPKIAMFCTGGIRCEKATSFLKAQGFKDVYHLKGGILKYLEQVLPETSLWRGECFVFDRRVSVIHDLIPGSYQLCSICRRPFHPQPAGAQRGGYADGPCPTCLTTADEAQKARAEARQNQIDLARERAGTHLGPRKQVATRRGKT